MQRATLRSTQLNEVSRRFSPAEAYISLSAGVHTLHLAVKFCLVTEGIIFVWKFSSSYFVPTVNLRSIH